MPKKYRNMFTIKELSLETMLLVKNFDSTVNIPKPNTIKS